MARPTEWSVDPRPARKRGRKQHVFLLAVRETKDAPSQVYAVKASSKEEALACMMAEMNAPCGIEVAGRLGRDLARKLKLKPCQPRLI